MIVCDVGPRDGLQNERDVVAPPLRAELVNRLAAAGVPRVEAVSFVREDLVPQMAGAEAVVAAIDRHPGTEYSGLVLNEQGHARLRRCGLDRVNCTLAATESFNHRNGNASLQAAVDRVEAIVAAAERPVTVTISVAFGCPFEGRVDPGVVVDLCERLRAAEELVLADTIGVATPRQVGRLTERAAALGIRVGGHFHNTRNTGYANAVAALASGATVLDASIGGLGGCPFAPRATGNVATEDLVYLLEGDGVETRIDLDSLVRVSEWLSGVLGRDLPGQLYRTTPAPRSASTSAAE